MSLWPEQKHLEVTEENATAALQHAVTAQHPRNGKNGHCPGSTTAGSLRVKSEYKPWYSTETENLN